MNVVYLCQNGEEAWDGILRQIELHEEYITFTVLGRGSSLQAHMGSYNGVVWICFPEQEKGCTLAHPNDIFFNSEKLGIVLESSIDGITVSRGIQELAKYLSESIESNRRFES